MFPFDVSGCAAERRRVEHPHEDESRLIKSKKLRATKIDRPMLILIADIENMLDADPV
jgi:hypothetical protein